MGKVVCTDLAVEGAGVGDVFLGLFGIHWMDLVGSLGCRAWKLYFRIARRFARFYDSE